jgi:cytochrome c peroxidase
VTRHQGAPILSGFTRCVVLPVVLLAASCDKSGPAGGPISADEATLLRSLCLDIKLPPSPGNKFADNEGAATLGHAFFFDRRISANGKVACATCHDPNKHFTDGLPLAKGVGETPRNAPTIVGAAWLPFVFWDGRKDSLWSQALGPVESKIEHGFSRNGVAHLIAAHYRGPYEALFGELPELNETERFPAHARPVANESRHVHNVAWQTMTLADQHAINTVYANFGKALEAYERKVVPAKAAFDTFACGLQPGAASTGHKLLSDDAVAGARAFVGAAGCVNCHNGPLLTDKGFHNLGLPGREGVSGVDVGRTLGAQRVKDDTFSCGGTYSDTTECDELRFLNPRFEDFIGAFKTPSLRNVAETAPYMHAGQLKTLQDVLRHYKELPGKANIGHRDLVLRQIDADVNSDHIIAFLNALTGKLVEDKWLKP